MKGHTTVTQYMAEVRGMLSVGRREKARILIEVEEHLRETVQQEEMRGCTRAEAERAAIARFGTPEFIARQFAAAPSRHADLVPRRLALNWRMLILAVVGCLAVGGWWAFSGDGGIPGSAPRGGNLATSHVPAAATTAVGGTLRDAGLLIDVGNGPVQVSNRADAAVVRMPRGAVLYLNNFGGTCPSPCSPQFHLARSVNVAGHALTLGFIADAGSGTLFSPRPDGSLEASTSAQDTDAGTLMVYASGADGQSHRVAVDGRGHLLVDTSPLPGDVAIDMPTGEELDLSGMSRLGLFPSLQRTPPTEFLFTMCSESPCQLSYRVRSLVAPFPGAVRCLPASRGLELDNGAVRLQFKALPGYGIPDCMAQKNAAAGSIIAGYFVHYLVSATSMSGDPLSVVVTADGTLYVGQVATSESCPPCRGR